jgi:hypothetical protein
MYTVFALANNGSRCRGLDLLRRTHRAEASFKFGRPVFGAGSGLGALQPIVDR